MNLFCHFQIKPKVGNCEKSWKLIEGRLTFRSTCRPPSCECRRWKPVTLERIVDTIMRSRLCIRLSVPISITSLTQNTRSRQFLTNFPLVTILKRFTFARQRRFAIYMVIHETHLTKSRITLNWWLSRISLLRPLPPFFLISFLFLSIEQPYLTFSYPLLWWICFDIQLSSLIQYFFSSSLSDLWLVKKNAAYTRDNNKIDRM